MATGSQSLLSLRGAIELTEGAATTPTRFLYPASGGASFLVKKEGIIVELGWNKQDTVNDIISGIETVGFQVTDMPISYEDAGWWLSTFDAALGETPSTTDTSAYTRTGAPSQTDNTFSSTGVRSMHVQAGYSDLIGTVGWQLPGLIGEELTLNFNKAASGADTGCRMTARWMTASGRTDLTAYTGSLSDRTQTWVQGSTLSSYVDTTTSGSTADTNITDAQFHMTRGNVYHDGMDGTANHTSMHRPAGWMTEMTYRRKFTNKTEYNAYLGTAGVKTTRKVRIKAVGAQVGAVSALNTFQLDFIGKYTDMDEVGATMVNGLLYQSFNLRGVYDSTLGASWKFTSINNVATAYKTA